MNLRVKCDTANGGGEQQQLATVELERSASSAASGSSPISDEERDYTVVYVVSGVREGTVSIVFEARSDVYDPMLNATTSAGAKPAFAPNDDDKHIIRSELHDVHVYGRLSVEPKHLELIVGATYQILTSGGPSAPSGGTHLVYELSVEGSSAATSIKVDADGRVNALSVGQATVTVKAVGTASACQSPLRLLHLSRLDCHNSNSNNVDGQQQRVYSLDTLVVSVSKLSSVQLSAPLRSIKRGNAMPVHVWANDMSVSPLGFASAPHLRYEWSTSDEQLATLHHPLASHTAPAEVSNVYLCLRANIDRFYFRSSSFYFRFSSTSRPACAWWRTVWARSS